MTENSLITLTELKYSLEGLIDSCGKSVKATPIEEPKLVALLERGLDANLEEALKRNAPKNANAYVLGEDQLVPEDTETCQSSYKIYAVQYYQIQRELK